MKEFIPILQCFDGKNEIATPQKFATHVPDAFRNVKQIKEKGIHRAYIIFYDDPSKNKFLKKLKVVFLFHSGSTITKVFEYKNALIAISPLGGPAAANLMEELSVFGINEFIAIGSAGCLNEDVKDKFVLVEKAIRDEGTSYHYLKPSTYVFTDKTLNKELGDYLKDAHFEFKKAISWTNDAYYRETDKKIAMAKELRAVAVEMECASWCAVAKCRGFKFAQLLYFSDLVKQDGWSRLENATKGYHNDKRDLIITLIRDIIDKLNF